MNHAVELHKMKITHIYEDTGAEVWECPECGRMTMTLNTLDTKIVFVLGGNERAFHSYEYPTEEQIISDELNDALGDFFKEFDNE